MAAPQQTAEPPRRPHNPWDSARLSKGQRKVLLWIFAHSIVESEGHEGRSAAVRWKRSARTRAQSACVSRTLKRLEDRGLVERLNDATDAAETVERKRRGTHRTTHVRLSGQGRVVAARLLADTYSLQ